jgi:hypothetical protein
VVCHDGGGGGCFGRGSVRAVVGSDERWCSGRFRSGRGCREVVRASAREATVVASVVQPGEEDDRQAGKADQRPRPSGGWRRQHNGRGKGSGPNPEPGQNSKRNYFRISIDFRIWQNFGKLYKEI